MNIYLKHGRIHTKCDVEDAMAVDRKRGYVAFAPVGSGPGQPMSLAHELQLAFPEVLPPAPMAS